MELQRIDKDFLTNEDILSIISKYEATVVPDLDKLWNYYQAKNTKILNRRTPDPNNPDNKIVVSYGRKIITTFVGYAYRPKYITYKPNVEQVTNDEGEVITLENPIEEIFAKEIQQIFDRNNEHIKTSRAGRNTGIFGVTYELLYTDKELNKTTLGINVQPKFFSVDPREMIALYNYDPESKIKIAIRFYKMGSANKYMVEVYYKDHIETYIRTKQVLIYHLPSHRTISIL